MYLFLIVTVFISVTTAELDTVLALPLSDEFINYINTVQNSWTAGRNFHPETSTEYLKKLQGVFIDKKTNKLPLKWHKIEGDEELPENFDARVKWPNCKSLKEIRDQGNCGGCWAIAAVSAMTDRFCIFSEGKQNFHFSTIDLLACSVDDDNGCSGGSPSSAWEYYQTTGIVSGGNYNSSTGCRPYPYRNCNHYQTADDGYPNCHYVEKLYEDCKKSCISNEMDYKKDKKRAKTVYTLQNDEEQIKHEIYKSGSVEATFSVFSDLLSYKKGVYKHIAGVFFGGHAVKIIGWGVENNSKYWLIVNSWNEHWGDKGLFKILRGENHCGIEDFVIAGEPLLN